MRVQSSKPITLKSGEVGYIHTNGEEKKTPVRQFRPPVKAKPNVDFEAIISAALDKNHSKNLEILAGQLEVPFSSLEFGSGVGVVRLPKLSAWGFPMRNADYKVVGIRTRFDNGDKRCITGTDGSGIFLPLCDPKPRLYVVEGPTDCAAALACGMFAIGRPNCSAGAPYICEFVRKNQAIKEVVIIADNDTPGITGGKMLSAMLPVKSMLVTLPSKDMREFYHNGGDEGLVNSLVSEQVWKLPARQCRS